jgi:adenylate kinase family enzyme
MQLLVWNHEGDIVVDINNSQALLEHLKHLNNGREETRKNRFGFILDGFPRPSTQADKYCKGMMIMKQLLVKLRMI